MTRFPRTTIAVAVAGAGAASTALIATGCSAGTATDQPSDAKVKLTVATFNEFGNDDLFAEYEEG